MQDDAPQTLDRMRAPQVDRAASGWDAVLADRLAEADRGHFISAPLIEDWVASWFGPDELPPPESDITPAGRA